MKEKTRLMLSLAVCLLFIILAFSNVAGKTLYNRNFAKEVKEPIYNAFKDDLKPPNSPILPYRQVLKPKDEGVHHKNLLVTQEWWYYNVVFDKSDSELRNWSLMISFNQGRIADAFFLTLFDDENRSYGGCITMPKGTIQATSPGVNVEFNNSYVIGTYPNWHIYAEDGDLDIREITVDLIYKADSLPLWSIMNTGHGISMSPMGHYSIIDCNVTGEIKINETVYNIHGVGYHEHSWLSFLPRRQDQNLIKNVWDYFCIHFDNGWDMLAGKISLIHQSSLMRFIPGTLWITPDGENISECLFFRVDYLETKNTTMHGVDIPTKIHINALFLNTIIKNPFSGLVYMDIYIETKNIHEFIWGSPPSIGLWEGTCKVNGTINWSKNNIKLNGSGMIELARVAS